MKKYFAIDLSEQDGPMRASVYKSAEVDALNASIGWAVRQLLQDLPQQRDWLNPDIERVMHEFDSNQRARGL